ncbi:transcription factor bHLH19-like [Coffea eugenioides]|uniref:transcription factor bHLH19-like n=1 Tax=Coffea eugenioides TaxID=49369 RepID=UPI000F610D94|nr:transcription factor bHLH19-like [Coffea eugenioides]
MQKKFADKRRRETLKQFIVLSTLLPSITKTDKISIIEEAVKHIRQLKEEIDKLKQYYPKQAVLAKKSQGFENQESCSRYESSLVSCERQLPEIEVRMYEKNILLTI